MHDRDPLDGYVEHLRIENTYRPHLVHVAVIVNGGQTETDYSWCPPSKAALQRMLTRPRDEYPCTEWELEAAISQAVAQGLLDSSSTPAHLILGGYGGGGR
ncbi:hypothetical protein BH708_03910 [Brachybacterium sp. P6-10-X1]|uniref:hypothetical protein n=1 Tax=Brachybacterium sp. P6-10-X1 TaxID=1903186 RepID=UPI000971A28E|nr:hypothetical protein [Brachybacterium sp. P6-10-X1]APX32014.1 hypothetical protein BH708_03910 [Brachybacterium sp. P6-10-X1]